VRFTTSVAQTCAAPQELPSVVVTVNVNLLFFELCDFVALCQDLRSRPL